MRLFVLITRVLSIALLSMLPFMASAQGFEVAFGNVQQDTDSPVEVTADSLSVNQKDGSATFTGNVLIGQGDMRISAPTVDVFYNEDTSGISRLIARGGVTVVSGEDAAESDDAEYNLDDGMILMSGNVLLSQGGNTVSSDNMVFDIDAGTAQMTGRVKTILRPEGN